MPEENDAGARKRDPASLALRLLLAAGAACTILSLVLFTTSMILQDRTENIPQRAVSALLDHWALGFFLGLGVAGLAVAIRLIRRGGK